MIARYAPNSPAMRVSTRTASSTLAVVAASGSRSGSVRQPIAYIATPSASLSSMFHSLPSEG